MGRDGRDELKRNAWTLPERLPRDRQDDEHRWIDDGRARVRDIPRPERPVSNHNVHAEMVEAFGRHQAGELAAAARGYQGILVAGPRSRRRGPPPGRGAAPAGAVGQGHRVDQQGRGGAAQRRAVPCQPRRGLSGDRPVRSGRGLLPDGTARSGKIIPRPTTTWAWHLQALGQRPRPPEHYEAALALRPGDAQTHSNLGTALRSMGQVEPALEHFKRAVELNPKLASARTNLGQYLLDLGRAEEALPHCREAVALEPNLAEAHNNLGNAYRATKQYTEARASYFEALRINPELAQSPCQPGAHPAAGRACRRSARPGSGGPPSSSPTNLRSGGSTPMLLTELERHPEAIECLPEDDRARARAGP